MPFKDNHNWPDDDFGWDGKRSAHLGAAVLHPIYAVLEKLR
jgi:murein tripeptide amidase MpaA